MESCNCTSSCPGLSVTGFTRTSVRCFRHMTKWLWRRPKSPVNQAQVALHCSKNFCFWIMNWPCIGEILVCVSNAEASIYALGILSSLHQDTVHFAHTPCTSRICARVVKPIDFACFSNSAETPSSSISTEFWQLSQIRNGTECCTCG